MYVSNWWFPQNYVIYNSRKVTWHMLRFWKTRYFSIFTRFARSNIKTRISYLVLLKNFDHLVLNKTFAHHEWDSKISWTQNSNHYSMNLSTHWNPFAVTFFLRLPDKFGDWTKWEIWRSFPLFSFFKVLQKVFDQSTKEI